MGQPAFALNDAFRSKALPRDEERSVLIAWRSGDRRAREGLIRATHSLVVAIALEYRRWGVPLDDLIQQGAIGVLRAADKFEPERDVRFATYASYWIRAEIRDYVIRAYRLVRIGTTKSERRAIRSFRLAPTDDPGVLAARSGLTPERSAELMPLLRGREASFEGAFVEDSFPAARLSPEEEVAACEAQARAQTAIARALTLLSDRERFVVEARALCEDDAPSLSELGAMLGVTKERVRQIEQRAWQKLRESLVDLRSDRG